jgi:hypothetical protein
VSDQGSEGSKGACIPKVSVQGRFACPPSDTAVVTAWEVVTPKVGAGGSLLAAAAAAAAAAAGSSSSKSRRGSSGEGDVAGLLQLSGKAGGSGKADKAAATAAGSGGGWRNASKQSTLKGRS